MSDLEFRMLKEAAESLSNDLPFAASGVPEPKLNDDGWFDAISKKLTPHPLVAHGARSQHHAHAQ